MFMLTFWIACTGEAPVDTGEPDTDEEEIDWEPCETLEIRVTGEDPPRVGDTWTMFLWCDDALMTGAQRILWDPNDIATVEDNTSRFLYAGEATLTMQAGSQRATRAVTVGE